MLRMFIVVCTAFLTISSQGAESESIKQAQRVFDAYVVLGDTFDPKAVDLYSDAARIQMKIVSADGSVRELAIPTAQFKKIVREAMPVARDRGDTNTFSEVKYSVEGNAVRITMKRYSVMNKYTVPHSMLVAQGESGEWKIVEELSELKR